MLVIACWRIYLFFMKTIVLCSFMLFPPPNSQHFNAVAVVVDVAVVCSCLFNLYRDKKIIILLKSRGISFFLFCVVEMKWKNWRILYRSRDLTEYILNNIVNCSWKMVEWPCNLPRNWAAYYYYEFLNMYI